jgi:hypothetical protein
MIWIKRLLCKIGWHKKGSIHIAPDDPLQFQQYAKCQWCGYEGMIDSQGNLF